MMRSTSSPLAVSMITGVELPSERNERHSSRPSASGSIRSSTIKSKWCPANSLRIAAPFAAPRAQSLLYQIAFQQIAQTQIVVDDQYVGGVHRLANIRVRFRLGKLICKRMFPWRVVAKNADIRSTGDKTRSPKKRHTSCAPPVTQAAMAP